MKKLLYIDCCIRGEKSRTKRLADAFLGALSDRIEVETVDLNELDLLPLNRERLERREKAQLGDPIFALAKQFATAQLIVIAAPFWDMGIPALLRSYFENVSAKNVTFGADENGYFGGLCHAEMMIYLTTRGMDIEDGGELEQASPYLKALVAFFGIGNFEMISACGLDEVSPEEAENRLVNAENRAKLLGRKISSPDYL